MRRSLLFSFLLAVALSAFGGGRGFTYVYARGGGSTITLTHGTLDEVLRLQKRFSGTYLWARLSGREFLIRDAAMLAEVARAARPIEALEPDYRRLQGRMKPLERRQDQLEHQLDAIHDGEDGDRSSIRTLESQLRAIERELRVYEREEARLDRRQEVLEQTFDAAVE